MGGKIIKKGNGKRTNFLQFNVMKRKNYFRISRCACSMDKMISCCQKEGQFHENFLCLSMNVVYVCFWALTVWLLIRFYRFLNESSKVVAFLSLNWIFIIKERRVHSKYKHARQLLTALHHDYNIIITEAIQKPSSSVIEQKIEGKFSVN